MSSTHEYIPFYSIRKNIFVTPQCSAFQNMLIVERKITVQVGSLQHGQVVVPVILILISNKRRNNRIQRQGNIFISKQTCNQLASNRIQNSFVGKFYRNFYLNNQIQRSTTCIAGKIKPVGIFQVFRFDGFWCTTHKNKYR